MQTGHEAHVSTPVQNAGSSSLLRALMLLPVIGLVLFLGALVTGFIKYQVLSWVIFLPIAGAIGILFIQRKNEKLIKMTAFVLSVVVFLMCIPLFTNFDKTTPNMQFTEKFAWVPAFNINYAVGIDGISMLFVLLSALLTILC